MALYEEETLHAVGQALGVGAQVVAICAEGAGLPGAGQAREGAVHAVGGHGRSGRGGQGIGSSRAFL